MLNSLTFEHLSITSLSRAKRWHGSRENITRTIPGYGMLGWSLSDWMTATLGELGEASNKIKKLNRVRDGMIGNKEGETEASLRADLAGELADVAIYLDLMAQAAGIDLGTEIVAKFNETSAKHNFPERLVG